MANLQLNIEVKISKMNTSEVLSVDLIVVGGGGAGLSAAISAAEKGVKQILILETRGILGGNAMSPIGIFAAESELQKRLGIDANTDDIFRKAMDYAHWKTNPKLVRALIEKSSDTISWLETKGVEFTRIHPLYPNQIPQTFHFVKEPDKTGATVTRALIKDVEKSNIKVRLNTRAKKLLIDRDGVITGIAAESENSEIKIEAKAVIIATGGFAGNDELIKKYIPTYDKSEIHRKGIPHNGDGLQMAVDIGADTDNMVSLEIEGPEFPWARRFSRFNKRPFSIWINKYGERFVDESIASVFAESANALFRQPGKFSFTLFDENIKNLVIRGGITQLEELLIDSHSWNTGFDDDFKQQVLQGRAIKSDSWQEIAEWTGIPFDTLKANIDQYNTFCNKGHDDIFAKSSKYLLPLLTPPFYAYKCCINFLVTHGGIKINERTEVLNKDNKPIAGLYAAGVETGGTDSDTYNAHITGHSFGFVINSGRIAGENAASYVTEN